MRKTRPIGDLSNSSSGENARESERIVYALGLDKICLRWPFLKKRLFSFEILMFVK